MTRNNDNPLADYPAEYAACRVDRHRWSRTDEWHPAGRNHSARIRDCMDCGKRKTEIINRSTWQRVGIVRYEDPKGFAMPRMGLTQDDYRKHHLANAFKAAGAKKKAER